MKSETRSRRSVLAAGVLAVATTVTGCLDGGDEPTVAATFDDGREGWTATDLTSHDSVADPDWSETGTALDLSHVGEGGVDGSGYVERVDTTGNAFFFDASEMFLGDRSEYLGGTLEFYLRSTTNEYREDSAVVLTGASGTVVTPLDPPGRDWTRFEVALDAESRDYRNRNLRGPTTGRDGLAAVLGDLQALRISGEHGGVIEERVGLDEVRLRSA
jgi:hypothetical protein